MIVKYQVKLPLDFYDSQEGGGVRVLETLTESMVQATEGLCNSTYVLGVLENIRALA